MMNFIELFAKPLLRHLFVPEKTNGKSVQKTPASPPKLSFLKFKIKNFKGIDQVEVDLAKNSLILLLGLNESGKTTVLRAIESFSFMNDPEHEFSPKFFNKIRKKSAIASNNEAIITAEISIEQAIPLVTSSHFSNGLAGQQDIDLINGFIHHVNEKGSVTISRVFPFENGSPKKYFYRFETEHPFGKHKLASDVAVEIVNICPYILYFEDFKDRIPEQICVDKNREDSFDPIWYDIIDGLYYNTDSNFNIESFKKFHAPRNQMLDDAATVETRVNAKLNETFTQKWQKLSGVKEIDQTVLNYTHRTRGASYFTLKIKDVDGTTYSVDERSKGALWYLSFLMKTEFRSKKMRSNSGKPVFLIDEPASNLHSTAQVNMINDFKMLAEDTSIVYTTHSQYLISTQNIKNTYIIEKKDGVVNAEKWGNYLNRQDAQISYYQPLANLLNIIPNTFDVPWKNCVITEGPSDRHCFIAMYRILRGSDFPCPIYPSTSANDMSALISLSIGWNANFVVLLDADHAGKNAANKYVSGFALDKEVVHLPKPKIEKCFTDADLISLRNIVLSVESENKVPKKEFAFLWAIVAEDPTFDEQIRNAISQQTYELFEGLIDRINNLL